jgi:hypothetical protein
LPLFSSKEVVVIAKVDVPFVEVELRATTIAQPRSVAEKERVDERLRESDRTRLVDDTLDGSFPASDPPSWTASVARLSPAS